MNRPNPFNRGVVVQTKVAPQNRPAPKAPPVYRPQPVPKVLQTKAKPGTPTPIGVANSKPPIGAGNLKRPVAPPVYNPHPQLQCKKIPTTHARAPRAPQKPVSHMPARWPKSPAAQLKARNPNPGASRKVRSSNTVQRLVVFTHGPRLRQNNVAESIANMVDYGLTKTSLNDQLYPGGTREQFVTALIEPTLSVHAGELAKVAVSVASVPVQRVSYLMELPTRGNWQLRVSAANIKVKLANQPILEGVGIPIGGDEAGDLTLNVRGLPTNQIFGDLVETHEDVHVADIQIAIEEILKPWDARLSRMRNEGTRFEGFDEPTARARLYRAAGGTPREIAERFVNTLRQKGMAFHETDAGKAPSIVAMARSGPPENSVLDVYLQHRAGLRVMHERKLEAEERRVKREHAAYQQALSESLDREVEGPINAGSAGNSHITNDML
jgi:hypothetical protein